VGHRYQTLVVFGLDLIHVSEVLRTKDGLEQPLERFRAAVRVRFKIIIVNTLPDVN
jgi:hypothetical protein